MRIAGLGYVADDRGDHVDLSPMAVDGGTVAERPDALTSPVRLERTQTALRGAMKATAVALSGKKCPVEMDVAIVLCQPNEMTVQTEERIFVGEDCKRQDTRPDGSPRSRQLQEITLTRAR